MKKHALILAIVCLGPCAAIADDGSWQTIDSVAAFQFETKLLKGAFFAHDTRDLGKGLAHHGLRGMTYKGHDLHAPDTKVGAKRRHQGILNLYRVYSAMETFGALRDDQAEVMRFKDGAQLTWPASEARPVAITATWRLTGPARIDVSIEARPTKAIKNFELLPATYVPVEMVKSVYLGTPETPMLTPIRPTSESDENETYSFFPLGEAARPAQQNSGRIHSSWTWPTFVASETSALPIVFAGNDELQIIQFADPTSTSAVCVTPTPESGAAEEWNKVEQHSALYFSIFGRDVEAGEVYTSRLRLVVIDTPKNSAAAHLELYRAFLADSKG